MKLQPMRPFILAKNKSMDENTNLFNFNAYPSAKIQHKALIYLKQD